MALDDLKEKLKSKLHRSNHRRSTSTTESNSQAPNRSSVASDRPAHDRLSHDHNVGCMFAPQSSFTLGKSLTSAATTTKSKPPVAPATPVSNYTSSRQSSISSLDNNSRPGLHNIDNTGYKLPQVPREQDFSSGFTGLTFGSQQTTQNGESAHGRISTQLDEGHNSENIADRNLTTSPQNATTVRMVPQSDEHYRSQPLIPNVAGGSRIDAPQPLNVKKRIPNQRGAEAVTSNGLEHDGNEMRDASWSVTPLAMEGVNDKSPLDARGRISNLNREIPTLHESQLAPRRSSLDKPLPLTPPAAMSLDRNLGANSKAFGNASNVDEDFLARAKQGSAGPFNLDGVDVKKEPDTVSVHEYHAPAVTHEVISKERHETRQQVITREVHDYHIYHRILPIIDIEVLPARHFVPIQNGYVEIDEEELPGRTRDKVNWAIAEMVSKKMPVTREGAIARHFTARKFEGLEGEDKQYIGPEGHPVDEKWWVYPPTLCEDSYRAGQTYPFHFGAADPKENGLKALLPAGNVVGVSRRLMEKRQKAAELMAASAHDIPRKPVPTSI
jgi:hypothetical protein